MLRLNYSTVEDREKELDVRNYNFKSKDELLSFIKFEYHKVNDNKPVVFIAMFNRSEFQDTEDSTGYFVSANFNEILDYLFKRLKDNYFNVVTLFEEYTYKDAFDYCKDHCEVHELGLSNNYYKLC